MTVGPLMVDPARRLVFVNGERADLTKREFDLLSVLAANAGWCCPGNGSWNWSGVRLRRRHQRRRRVHQLPAAQARARRRAAGDSHGARDRVRPAAGAVTTATMRPERRDDGDHAAGAVTMATMRRAPWWPGGVAAQPGRGGGGAGGRDRGRPAGGAHLGGARQQRCAATGSAPDSIVDASMYPEQLQDPTHGVLTTGRSRSTGQVVFQRGFQLPSLPPGSSTVTVNGVDYRVRTIPLEQSGGILVSIGIRADSILLSRARIPLICSSVRWPCWSPAAWAGCWPVRRFGRCAGSPNRPAGSARTPTRSRRCTAPARPRISRMPWRRCCAGSPMRNWRRRIRCRPPRTSRRMRPTNCAPR